jgi:hypothetical protein
MIGTKVATIRHRSIAVAAGILAIDIVTLPISTEH